jgi:hypothetical protein
VRRQFFARNQLTIENGLRQVGGDGLVFGLGSVERVDLGDQGSVFLATFHYRGNGGLHEKPVCRSISVGISFANPVALD